VFNANIPAVVPDCADIFLVFPAAVYVAYAASSAVCRRRRVRSLELTLPPFLILNEEDILVLIILGQEIIVNCEYS
jgi:hypothetical protein